MMNRIVLSGLFAFAVSVRATETTDITTTTTTAVTTVPTLPGTPPVVTTVVPPPTTTTVVTPMINREPSTGGVQVTFDSEYIYYKVPVKVTMDSEQTKALADGIGFISQQLKHLSLVAAKLDPDGDLKALSESVSALDTQTSLLTQITAQIYTDVAPFGFRLHEGYPSGYVLLVGGEFDRTVFTILKGGGSAMMGVVMVPMQITRISRKDRSQKTIISWTDNTNLIFVPVANLGAGVTTQTGPQENKRFSVGLIWGELNKASEFSGMTGGISVTLDIGKGINLKFLGLKNMSRGYAINNYLFLAGVESGNAQTGASKLPFIRLNAESHMNFGWIFDAAATFGSIARFVSPPTTVTSPTPTIAPPDGKSSGPAKPDDK